MKRNKQQTSAIFAGVLIFISIFLMRGSAYPEAREQPDYVVLAWNNLGMHCYNSEYRDLCVLPPYNTLWAQVVKIGDNPVIVTQGIVVTYVFEENTYSAAKAGYPDKTDFWKYVKDLFGVELAPNVGLTGKGLSGTMDLVEDHFEAVGIPLTEYRDQDVTNSDRSTWNRYPYQLATVIVKDTNTGTELCRTKTVAPISSELNCAQCHKDDGRATQEKKITPQGRATLNILALHDKLNKGKYKRALLESRPVLCANCHASNALGMKGKAGILSLSNAMHNRHKAAKEITPDTAGCYRCHPGNVGKCLRDVMSTEFILNCTTCHGTMGKVAKNKNPWLSEPRCDNASCHGPGYKLDRPRYQLSRGTGGIYCAGCHDSPHVIAPSREGNDNLKRQDLQGSEDTLSKCTVCHTSMPTQPFTHNVNK